MICSTVTEKLDRELFTTSILFTFFQTFPGGLERDVTMARHIGFSFANICSSAQALVYDSLLTCPFGVILSWILGNKLPLGIGYSGRIARLMRWNETRTYWLGFSVWFVAAWPFQAEDFSSLAWGSLNWTVKPCPFSYSGNSRLKEIA